MNPYAAPSAELASEPSANDLEAYRRSLAGPEAWIVSIGIKSLVGGIGEFLSAANLLSNRGVQSAGLYYLTLSALDCIGGLMLLKLIRTGRVLVSIMLLHAVVAAAWSQAVFAVQYAVLPLMFHLALLGLLWRKTAGDVLSAYYREVVLPGTGRWQFAGMRRTFALRFGLLLLAAAFMYLVPFGFQ